MALYTGRVTYVGFDKLDVTVKGQHPFGRHFAPTWEMVREYRAGRLSQADYTTQYIQLLNAIPKDIVKRLIKLAIVTDITLCCYEQPGEFCHRHLLYNWLMECPILIGGGERP